MFRKRKLSLHNLFLAVIFYMVIFLSILSSTASIASSKEHQLLMPKDKKSILNEGRLNISWPDIVKLVDKHPQIGANYFKVEAAQAEVAAASAFPNPSLETSTAYGKALDNSESRVEWGLALSIPLDWMIKINSRVAMAKAEVQTIEAETKTLRYQVLVQLNQLFWKLIYYQERADILSELSNQTKLLLQTVRRRVEIGESRPVEAFLVEMEAENIFGKLEAAISDLEVSATKLALWLGVGADTNLKAVADLTAIPQPFTKTLAIETSLKNHPEILAAMARVRSFSAKVDLEYKNRIPSFSMEAFVDHELDRKAYGIGVSIDLPLWNWNAGNIQYAQKILAAEKLHLIASKREIESLTMESQTACQSGINQARRFKDKILPLARSVVKTIEKTYNLGEVRMLELVDARRTLLETKLRFIDIFIGAQTDCHGLRIILGEELP